MALIPLARPEHPLVDAAPRRYTDAPTIIAEDGYVWEWCPTHPKASRGVVLQHRLVVECRIGRFLTKEERIHHDNEHRWDNRDDNLVLHRSHAEHMIEHWSTKGRRSPEWIERVRKLAADPTASVSAVGLANDTVRKICQENGIQWMARQKFPRAAELTEQSVREALRGRTSAQAADFLGVAVMSLYRRFGHLLNKRTSPKVLDPHKAEIRGMLRQRMTRQEIADHFGVCRQTLTKSIQRWNAIQKWLEPNAIEDAPAGLRYGSRRHIQWLKHHRIYFILDFRRL